MQLSPKVQQSLDKVVKQFKNGDLSVITKAVAIKADPLAPVNNWSFANRVIAYIQAEEIDCRGYRQWQAVDRQVKKGSSAVYILSPRMVKKKQSEGGEEEDKKILVGFTPVPVFPASSTTGETQLPEYEPNELPPLMDVAKRLGIKVTYKPVAPDRLGDYRANRINLGSEDPSVFFHELGHAIHDRIGDGLRHLNKETKETVAEFTATVLMSLYGFQDHSGNAWAYISHYASDPLQAITKSLGTVEKILAVLTNEAN